MADKGNGKNFNRQDYIKSLNTGREVEKRRERVLDNGVSIPLMSDKVKNSSASIPKPEVSAGKNLFGDSYGQSKPDDYDEEDNSGREVNRSRENHKQRNKQRGDDRDGRKKTTDDISRTNGKKRSQQNNDTADKPYEPPLFYKVIIGNRKVTNFILICAIICILSLLTGVIYTIYVQDFQDTDIKKIQFWIDGEDPVLTEYINSVVDRYNGIHNDMQIILKSEFRDYTASVTYAYVRGGIPTEDSKTPDINLVSGEYMRDIFDIGKIMPASKIFDNAAVTEYTAMFDGIWAEGVNMTDGEKYAFPFYVNTYRMIYNRELFTYAGIDSSAPPETVSGFIDMCRSLKAYSAAENRDFAHMALPGRDAPLWLETIKQIGRCGGIMSYDHIEGQKTYKRLSALTEIFVESDIAAAGQNMTFNEVCNNFLNGKCAVMFTDYQTFKALLKSENTLTETSAPDLQIPDTDENSELKYNISGKWAAAVLPVPDGEYASGDDTDNSYRGAAFSDVTYITVNKNTVYKAETAEFLRYLLSDEVMMGLAKNCGLIPSRWSTLCSKASGVQPDRRQMIEKLSEAGLDKCWLAFFQTSSDRVYPMENKGGITDIEGFQSCLDRIFSQKQSVEEALTDFDTK